MIFLSLLPPLSLWIEVFIDSALLVVLLSPMLYFFLFNPLVMHITERRRAEEALAESEERYRKLVELSPEAIAVHSEGVIVFLNAAGAKLLGAVHPEQVIGKNIIDIVHPDYRGVVRERVRQMREEGKIVPLIEEKFVRLDGSVIDVEVAAMPLTYQGKPAIQVVIRDITERKWTEDRLRLFRNLINQSNDAIFVDDPETGRILDINDKACSSLSYTREELLNMRVFDIETTIPDHFSWKEHVKEVQRKGYLIIEGQNKRKDGTTFPVEVNVSYITIGEKSYTVAVARDITERKRAEEALRRAYDELEVRVRERTSELEKTNNALRAGITERKRVEEELKKSYLQQNAILNNIPDIAWLKDRESRFIAVNRPFAEASGRSPEDLVGKTDFDIWPRDLADGYRADDREVMRTGRRKQVEEPLVDKEGNKTWIETIKTPIYDDKGEIIGTTGIARDITERKRATEEHERWAAELARSNAELEQFAYIASHDLQEPLRMVSGFTQLLARRYKGKLDKDADEFIAYSVDGAVRMQRMIEDLLAYSRVGTRGKPFEPTSLETVFEQAMANLKVAIEESSATVTHDPLPVVMADATQMVQLFQNLIGNAIKFRKEEPPQVRILAKKDDNEWLISVKDNGIGIAPEFQSRLFQIFQRERTAREYPGTGIGLAICKKIVERHGGRIWAESVQGEGSTFYFTMPVRREESPAHGNEDIIR